MIEHLYDSEAVLLAEQHQMAREGTMENELDEMVREASALDVLRIDDRGTRGFYRSIWYGWPPRYVIDYNRAGRPVRAANVGIHPSRQTGH